MHWPIALKQFGDRGKCERDIDDYYYKQKHHERVPGEMYKEIGWIYGGYQGAPNPFAPMRTCWWKWGN